MEHRKVTGDEAGSARRVLIEPAEGFVYDLWVVRYSAQMTAQLPNNASFRMGVSLRGIDLVDGPVINFDTLSRTPGVMFQWAGFHEVGSDVGIHDYDYKDTIALPKPITVPWLSWLWSESISTSFDATCEVLFEPRRPKGQEAVFLANRYRILSAAPDQGNP